MPADFRPANSGWNEVLELPYRSLLRIESRADVLFPLQNVENVAFRERYIPHLSTNQPQRTCTANEFTVVAAANRVDVLALRRSDHRANRGDLARPSP